MASYSGGSQYLAHARKPGAASGGVWSRPSLNKPHKLRPIPISGINKPAGGLDPLVVATAASGQRSGGPNAPGVVSMRQDSLTGASTGGLDGGPQRVVQLEKNIAFLQKQHEQTLNKLHLEIERLMQENRDLNFKVVMTQGKPMRSRDPAEEDADELRSIMLEEEARQLRNSLINEKNRNARLMKVIEQRRPKSNEPSDGESSARSSARDRPKNGTESDEYTLADCETIIKHLQQTNDRQSHELLQIKADLKDVLYSHKWTPDAFLMARAYVGNEERPELSSSSMPPNTANSQHPQETVYSKVRENISLPPLKVNQTSVAEKHRRMQAIKQTKKKPFFL